MKLYLNKIEEPNSRRDHVKRYNTVCCEDVKNELLNGDSIFPYLARGDCKFVKSWLYDLDGSIVSQLIDKAGWSILHDAVLLDEIEIVQYLISNPAMDINLPCRSMSVGLDKWRPIHVACEFGRFQVLKMLISAKANPELYMEVIKSELIEPIFIDQTTQSKMQHTYNLTDTLIVLEAWTPLHLTVIHDHIDCLIVLITEAKVFVDSRSAISRKTGLILASELCQLNMVKILLEFGADPNARDASGKSPLFYGARRGHASIVEILLKYGAKSKTVTKHHHISPLHVACMSRNADSLSSTIQLIKTMPDMVHWTCDCILRISNAHLTCSSMDCLLLTILVTAICVDDTQLNIQMKKIKYLLVDQKVNVNVVCKINDISNNNALHLLLIIAKKFQTPIRSDLIDLLLAHSIDINAIDSQNESILFSVVQLNLLGLANNLLKRSANPNVGRNHAMTPLMFSIHKRHKEMMKILINHGAKINEIVCLHNMVSNNIQFTNCTALHIALIYADQETFLYLLANGADPFLNVDIMSGRELETNVSFLHLAVLTKLNSIDYINTLLEIGLDIESKTSSGDTPFLFAVRYSNIDACRLLLSRGCNKDAFNCNNETALNIAAIRKNIDLMKLILDFGVNINKQDNDGFTALHHCFVNDFRCGIDLFLHNPKYNFTETIQINASCYELKSTYLTFALQFGNETDVLCLLEHGANPNSIFVHNDITMTPVFLTVENNSLVNLNHLIRYGADLNYISSPNHESILHVALRNKNVTFAKELIYAGVDIQIRSRMGQSEEVLPIHVAVQNGLDEIVEILIQFGCSINATMILKTVERVSPLHLAALNDLVPTVKFLTNQHLASININSSRSDSFNALLTLVSKKNVIGVETVLQAGADVNGKCIVSRSRNATCLHIAAQVGSVEIVRLLLEYGADPFARMITGDRDGILPIHLATESGHLGIVQLFFDWGVSVSAPEDCGLTCLHYAANAGCIDIMKVLLKAGADVHAEATDGNRSKMLPLHMAAEKGHKRAVKLLLEHGSPIDAVFSRVNRENLTALYIATSENREDVMKCLIKCGANPDIQESHLGATALHITCQRGFIKAIVYLIGIANSSLDISLNTGISPLHLTAEKGHNEMSFWLLRFKCNPNIKGHITDLYTKKTSYDISPLNQACGFGHLIIAKLLIKCGADIHWVEIFEGHRGIQPIHCAAIRGRHHVIPSLLEAGVSIDEIDEEGLTPLHWSVIEGFYDCTKFLIELGANINLYDKNGKKPADYAKTANLMSLF